MKKVYILLFFLVSVQCFGQNTIILQKQTDLIVKSFIDHSSDGIYYKKWIVRYNEIDGILSLKKYAKEIFSCYNPKTFTLDDYYIMCFFDSVPKSIVDTALTYSKKYINLPLIFKAKYGCDTIVTENLLDEIEKYFFSDTKDEISEVVMGTSHKYISYLFLINSEKAKNILYKIMESKKYTKRNKYDGRQDYKVSLSYIVIQYFLCFYPPDKPVSDINTKQFEVDEGHPIFSVQDINQSEFEQYKKDVEKYIYLKENKKITINTSFFNLGEYRVEKYIAYPDENK